MPILKSFEDLVALLTKDNTQFGIDRAQQVIEFPNRDPSLPGNLYLRWDKNVPFVQLIQVMLLDIAAARIPDIIQAIVRLNNKIEVPGVGLDEGSRNLYFRVVTMVHPQLGIEAELLYQLAQGTGRNALIYLPAFKAVVEGKPGTEIVELATAAIAGRQVQPAPST